MSEIIDFVKIGRLPAETDNVAIATKKLNAGTEIKYKQHTFRLDYTILEGHRFAVNYIEPGQPLLSWGLPFGIATRTISPGHYVHNIDMLEALAGRDIDFAIPREPNFRNQIEPYVLDEAQFVAGAQVPLYETPRTFQGFVRTGERGVGTRNFVVIIGTSSRTASYAQALANKLQTTANDYAQIDGITAVAHTEGDGLDPLNNRDFVLRTLAGLIVHPNVGAALIVDYGPEQINNDVLHMFMQTNNYALAEVQHQFLRLDGDFAADLDRGTAVIKSWLPRVNQAQRQAVSLSQLNIALQCGGSDAFSGVSGNPLAGSVAKEIIRFGGRANLGETDELIGAEPYMLQNVRDLSVAHKFLNFIAEFKERVSWHGASAEGNPSGGNRFRGLYNIALKSIGAGMKRHPDVRLDDVVDYAEPMKAPGFYFMNTPGNDLESIAGQVAGGSNLIFFVTGNGSITNFPFVPTIKLVTTTPRFEKLAQDMDVNAGAYQDGRSMHDLTADMLDLTIRIASGEKSKGEQAGHSQISIWRNWRQTNSEQLSRLLNLDKPSGRPLPSQSHDLLAGGYTFKGIQKATGFVSQQIGLILPTSLCAGQIARMSAERLNQTDLAAHAGLSRFVALVHTEGCGVAVPHRQEFYNQTMISYSAHPMVRFGLFLEHGCEKTHNDYMRHELETRGLQATDFGWASVQMDGGIDAVTHKIFDWFNNRIETTPSPTYKMVDLSELQLGLMGLSDDIYPEAARSLAKVVRSIVARGGSVVLPEGSSLWQSPDFVDGVVGDGVLRPSLSYGQAITQPGLHMMSAPSRHWAETMTGLGATGVELIVAVGDGGLAGHPFIPMLRLGDDADTDLHLDGLPDDWAHEIMEKVTAVLNREYTPNAFVTNHVNFQLTRGLLGIST